ncbi:MAG: hypothetical protein ACOYN4_00825 [Bacteroidales bacterium]
MNYTFDSAVDWRNRNGINYMPEIFIGHGNMCVANATITVLSAMAAILLKRTPVLYSRADLYYCSSHGEHETAISHTLALESLRFRGACLEIEFPTDINNLDGLCHISPTRDIGAIQVTAWKQFTRTDIAKYYLTNVGPIVTDCNMSEDGTLRNHSVCIVGYSESGQYWIVRDSSPWSLSTEVYSWEEDYPDFDFHNHYILVPYGKLLIDDSPKYVITGVQDYVPMLFRIDMPGVQPEYGTETLLQLDSLVSWQCLTTADWCRIAPGNGNASAVVTLTTDPNPTRCPRFALLSFENNGSILKIMLVKQMGNPYA